MQDIQFGLYCVYNIGKIWKSLCQAKGNCDMILHQEICTLCGRLNTSVNKGHVQTRHVTKYGSTTGSHTLSHCCFFIVFSFQWIFLSSHVAVSFPSYGLFGVTSEHILFFLFYEFKEDTNMKTYAIEIWP